MKIKLSGNWLSREVRLNGFVLDPKPSQKIRNHSPDGFNWGYGGSGPAQLALAILLKVFGRDSSEVEDYQDFKFKVIGALPQSDFDAEITFNEDGLPWQFMLTPDDDADLIKDELR